MKAKNKNEEKFPEIDKIEMTFSLRPSQKQDHSKARRDDPRA